MARVSSFSNKAKSILSSGKRQGQVTARRLKNQGTRLKQEITNPHNQKRAMASAKGGISSAIKSNVVKHTAIGTGVGATLGGVTSLFTSDSLGEGIVGGAKAGAFGVGAYKGAKLGLKGASAGNKKIQQMGGYKEASKKAYGAGVKSYMKMKENGGIAKSFMSKREWNDF